MICNYHPLPEIANFSTKYFILSKIYTDEGGIYKIIISRFFPFVWEIINSLKLVDYLLVQSDILLYNYYLISAFSRNTRSREVFRLSLFSSPPVDYLSHLGR